MKQMGKLNVYAEYFSKFSLRSVRDFSRGQNYRYVRNKYRLIMGYVACILRIYIAQIGTEFLKNAGSS